MQEVVGRQSLLDEKPSGPAGAGAVCEDALPAAAAQSAGVLCEGALYL